MWKTFQGAFAEIIKQPKTTANHYQNMQNHQNFFLVSIVAVFTFGALYGLAAEAPTFFSCRPAVSNRCFSSAAVERRLGEVKARLGDAKLAWVFENCFPNTLDTTVRYQKLENGDDDTFVITGDIHAMWLRDSAAQVWPYLPLAKEDPRLQALLRGVVIRQFKSLALDPYANAFNFAPTPSPKHADDLTEMKPGVFERKYELDSLCYPLRLAHGYWKATGDATPFGSLWVKTVRTILATMRTEQRHAPSPYKFQRKAKNSFDTLPLHGRGMPARPIGLIASSFQPSDDATVFPFLVPSNLMAVDVLGRAAEILRSVNRDEKLAAECEALAAEVRAALERHATVIHPKYGKIWAFEVDGYGSVRLGDDANVPNLLSLPYIAGIDPKDPVYRNTRAFVLSEDNPFFFKGTEAEGVGGSHTGSDKVWPMSIILRGLTSERQEEIDLCIKTLVATDGGTGFMHESFDVNDSRKFTRTWFAWANTLFGELILHRYGR